MMSCFQRLKLFSALVRATSICSTWQLTQRPPAHPEADSKRLRRLNPKWDI